MKKLIMVLFLFCWCNIYGQESITDTTGILSDDDFMSSIEISGITTEADWDSSDSTTVIYWEWPVSQSIVELIELYEGYETQCFNDSTKQCFNYYRNYHFNGVFEDYKTPCGKYDYDLGIDASYKGTHEEWVHVQPSFIGFMRYLKKKRI